MKKDKSYLDKRQARREKKQNAQIDIISFNLEEESQSAMKKRIKRTQDNPAKVKGSSNKELARVTYVFVAVFLSMMCYLVGFNLFKRTEIINNPHNVRLEAMAANVIRGVIYDNDMNVIAETEVMDYGLEKRVYPYGKLYAHVVGFDSHGRAGLESAENLTLLTSGASFWEKLTKTDEKEKEKGNSIVTTLDTELQQAAYDALGKRDGAVIVMEPSTGKILAMVSKPDYDPNDIFFDWDVIFGAEDSALYNRAMQGLYAPGSCFKVVTTLAFMRQNKTYNEYIFDCQSEMTAGDYTVHCINGRDHGDEMTLQDSFAWSCNSSFANIGLSLNLAKYRDTAEDLMFNKELPTLLPYEKSQFQITKDTMQEDVMTTAMGQGETLVSPYHMALITSTIANGGILMKPYLVERVINSNGIVVDKNVPEKYATLMTSKETADLTEYMVAVMEYGTGRHVELDKYTMAGKTGTAEFGSDESKEHSWFIGFSNVEDPDLVISVVLEGVEAKGKKAYKVAKEVFDAYYE